MTTKNKCNVKVYVHTWWAQRIPEGNLHREILPVFVPHYAGDKSAGYAVCLVNEDQTEAILFEGEWSREEALEVISMGGKVFSGHRCCPGKKVNEYLEKALNVWAPNWYSQIDEHYGPSSWTVDVRVENDRVFADNVEIKED